MPLLPAGENKGFVLAERHQFAEEVESRRIAVLLHGLQSGSSAAMAMEAPHRNAGMAGMGSQRRRPEAGGAAVLDGWPSCMNDLTRPENCAERRDRLRIMRKVRDAGGCLYCTKRETAWGGCSLNKEFPVCVLFDGPFELDNEAIAGAKDDW